MGRRDRWIRGGVIAAAMVIMGGLLIHGAQEGTSSEAAAMDEEEAAEVLTLVGFVNQVRMDASRNTGMALRQWATPDFMERWDSEVMTLFEKPEMIMWEDFFSGSVVWVGTIQDGAAIAALYSPWCDGIVVLHVTIDGWESRMTDFRIMSGEALRKEAIPTASDVQKTLRLYVGGEAPTVALSRLYADSLNAFEAAYLGQSELKLLPARLADRVKKDTQETAMLKGRMIYRQYMFRELLAEEQNSRFLAQTGLLLSAIEEGEPDTVRGLFSPEQSPLPLDSLLEIPEEIRSHMTVAFFGRKGEEGLVGLMSPVAPKWIFMVLMQDGDDDSLVLKTEMLDLDASSQVLELLNRKGMR